jgi:8-oxo-dGTP pyrophosphatase MutT (NUDIX family)
MDLISLIIEAEGKWKSGGFPFAQKDGEWFVGMFASNNPSYGGANPQMPKGHSDPGENFLEAGSREVSEETGIPLSRLRKNAVYVGSFSFKGEVSKYDQHVFAFKLDTIIPMSSNDEGKGVWIALKDAPKKMRKDQVRFLIKAAESINLTAEDVESKLTPPKWRKPDEKELRLEYQLEYVNKGLSKMTGNRWPTVEDFLNDANSADLTEISPSEDDRMSYRSHTESRSQLVSLLKSYRSWPEFRNMNTVARLYDGLSDGSTLPAPIVLNFGGKLRILGGNTRADAFRQLYPGKSHQALILKV